MKPVLPAFAAALTVSLALPSLVAAQTSSGASGAPRVGAGTSPFMRGVPTGTATSDTLALSVGDAITRALAHNMGVLVSEHGIERARGRQVKAQADLLPNIGGRISESRQESNLSAYGFPLPAGVPPVVGPFNIFDARLFVSQAVFDLKALREARAEGHSQTAARLTAKNMRDTVVLVAANAYLQALAAEARAASAQAQLRTAEAIHAQTVSLKAGGLVAGIDVLRADVQRNAERQRATAASNDAEKAKLQLARLIGLPLGQAISLSDQLPFVPAPDMSLEAALERAYRTRPDYQSALEHVRAADAKRQAAAAEALPSVRVNADVGAIGQSVGDALRTFSVAGAVNVPIFQGGRRRGRLLETTADLRDRQADAEDLKAEIYYDVRIAFLDLQTAAEQHEVAGKGRDLANQQLEQARDRLAAGISDNVEVVQAQEAVALANERYIAALYGYNVAKALLARGLGVGEDAIRQYLKGNR